MYEQEGSFLFVIFHKNNKPLKKTINDTKLPLYIYTHTRTYYRISRQNIMYKIKFAPFLPGKLDLVHEICENVTTINDTEAVVYFYLIFFSRILNVL